MQSKALMGFQWVSLDFLIQNIVFRNLKIKINYFQILTNVTSQLLSTNGFIVTNWKNSLVLDKSNLQTCDGTRTEHQMGYCCSHFKLRMEGIQNYPKTLFDPKTLQNDVFNRMKKEKQIQIFQICNIDPWKEI